MNNSVPRHKSTCHYCGDALVGRSDKRFCNSACRNALNNAKRITTFSVIKAVNKTLLKNFNILNHAWLCGEIELSKTVLIKRGFNMNYFTSIQHLGKSVEYKFCYDIGYSLLNENTIRILKKEKKYPLNKTQYHSQHQSRNSLRR
jgi:predicted nucleic acid-binding Zn ribbon protein